MTYKSKKKILHRKLKKIPFRQKRKLTQNIINKKDQKFLTPINQ